ncbi:hypothetical protein LUZ60_008312 [Juncus effusus]|nr:hypothetical protein LUZ60_008312 [Juncus effusus]
MMNTSQIRVFTKAPFFSTSPSRHFSISPFRRRTNVRFPLPHSTFASIRMESKGQKEELLTKPSFTLLFVEMGVGYDQHGQDITVAAMRACKDAISSNSIPAFRQGAIPGVNSDQMKLKIQLGVPKPTQHLLDSSRVKSVFPYGEIISFEVVDGGMICSSGTCIEAMGDKNDDCYIVNAAIYVGY